MVQNLKEWCGPNHRPVWTEVGVTSLGVEGMRIEIEVEAWIGWFCFFLWGGGGWGWVGLRF
jgi:hypothetical protein